MPATRSAFATYEAAQKAIQSNSVAVQANELALEGARAEQSVGTRTVLDVLNAEQELLNSQVALVTAKRDAYVAGFQLLNAMGQAEAHDLGLDGGPLYDPLGNYRRVAGSWNDWATDPRHVPVATRTVDPTEMPQQPAVTPEARPGTGRSTEPVVTSGVTSAAAISDSAAMQSPGREPVDGRHPRLDQESDRGGEGAAHAHPGRASDDPLPEDRSGRGRARARSSRWRRPRRSRPAAAR